LHTFRTFALAGGSTRSLEVPYPDALEFGGSKYTGTVRILPPGAGARGGRPSLAKVAILRRGSILGGSDYRATVHNQNPPGTAPVRVQITATTQLPHGR
jgi:hypothetical protein